MVRDSPGLKFPRVRWMAGIVAAGLVLAGHAVPAEAQDPTVESLRRKPAQSWDQLERAFRVRTLR